jgi:dihydroflavonol-4-reductase
VILVTAEMDDGSMKIKVLVTGANGFLATNTIQELLSKGYIVSGMVRNKTKSLPAAYPGLEVHEGRLDDDGFLDRCIPGCAYILHIAAETRQGLSRYEDYHNVNVSITEKLFDACVRHNVKRFVYISTANTLGFGSFASPGNESDPMMYPFSRSWYAMSKLRSEEAILAKRSSLETVILHPTFMLGAYDQKPGSGRIILMNYGKKFIFYPPGGKNFVHVKDVARGIVAAMEKGRDGESYLLCNENLSYKEFLRQLSAHSGRSSVLIKIPSFVLISLGVIGNFLQAIGIKNEFVLNNMRILCVRNFYSGAKARRDLGIEPTPVNHAIKDAVRWFREKKMI